MKNYLSITKKIFSLCLAIESDGLRITNSHILEWGIKQINGTMLKLSNNPQITLKYS